MTHQPCDDHFVFTSFEQFSSFMLPLVLSNRLLRIHLDKVSAFASNETGELIFFVIGLLNKGFVKEDSSKIPSIVMTVCMFLCAIECQS